MRATGHSLALGIGSAHVGAVVDGRDVLNGLSDHVRVDRRRRAEDERPHVTVQALASLDPGTGVPRALPLPQSHAGQEQKRQRQGAGQKRHFHSLRRRLEGGAACGGGG